ncbi:MAG: hypothetical protein GF409_06015 [Candidatus Omnitrophica bacterium]|nr:hypothetical protein [Candidatus Omnitrophota bacterium]
MKRTLLAVLLAALITSGCSSIQTDIGTFMGQGPRDLQKARSKGSSRLYALPYQEAFGNVESLIKSQGLKIYQLDRERGYIVVIGLPRQTDTTRVGIFFDAEGEEKTRITLSSLSSSALVKAENMIFGSIKSDVVIID